jgi:surface protein
MIGVSQISVAAYRGGGGAAPVNLDFVSTWDTTKAGSASNTVVLPLVSGGVYSGTIDWGDTSTSVLSYANRSHTYASGGVYTITISGTIEGWRFVNAGDKLKIINIGNWGLLVLASTQNFWGCSNLDISATDAPTITSASIYRIFMGCVSLTTPDFRAWDVSGVNVFLSAFEGATNFNGNVSTWDTSIATSMGSTFKDTSFNGDVSGWKVDYVTTFQLMFKGSNFNQDISGWEFSVPTTFINMFQDTPFNKDISGWDTTNASSASQMFFGATSFNQNISGWETSNMTAMYRMFRNTAFDQDISSWTITQVTSFTEFLKDSQLSTINYDALLIAWDAQGAMTFSGTADFGGSKYTAGGAAEAARTSLIAKWGGIIDGGAA